MTASESVAVRLDRCAKTFPDGTRALEPMTLDIAGGETMVFLGPSGCGKTTTLRIIAGLERPDAGGRVLFDGEDVTLVPIERRNVGMVFQSYALFPNMTVAENICYGLKIRGIASKERMLRLAELVALTGIAGLEQRGIDQLSGGQRQRVALAARPRVLLLDEPLTALDASLRERLRGDLNRLLRSLGITAIYVTHDQIEAMALGDRIVVMRNGAIAQIGAPRDIYFAPADRFVAEFIGTANVIEATAKAGVITLPGGRIAMSDAKTDGAVVVMIRPETIRIVAAGEGTLAGRVETVSFVGDRVRLTVTEAAPRALAIDAANTIDLGLGDRVGLAIDPAAVLLLERRR